ncbi:MAG: M20 family peptidase [Myxococcota bacterium]
MTRRARSHRARRPAAGRTALGLAAVLALLAPASARAADDGAVERLAAAVRIPTISPQSPEDFDGAPFLAFHDFLARAYPCAHGTLERETVADYSLLYTWRGADASLEPVLLTAHIDVVPVIEESLGRWTHPPFDGVVADGYVWGRGTLDDKAGLLAVLEGVESLCAAGFAPARTVYLAFGHDEELGGNAGAAGITDLLASRGVALWFSLDEGMAILDGAAGIEQPMALVGVAEKGFLTLEMTARARGGHSSLPPRESAIGALARAIERIESNPLPAHTGGLSGRVLDTYGEAMSGATGFALRHRWLFGPFVRSGLDARPESSAMIRTTTAVTVVRGGVKSNVLPSSATALVNFRIHPEDTVESVVEHARRAIDDPEIELRVVEGREASAVSPSEGPAWDALVATVRETHGDLPVGPALVLGGTDSKHYGRIASAAYRFAPLRMRSEDTSRLHGIDERIAVDAYLEMPPFYAALVRRAAGAEAR